MKLPQLKGYATRSKAQNRDVLARFYFCLISLRAIISRHNPALFAAQLIFCFGRGLIQRTLRESSTVYYPRYLEIDPSQIQLWTLREKGLFNISRLCDDVDSLVVKGFENDITMEQLKQIILGGGSWRSLNSFAKAKSKLREDPSAKNKARLMLAIVRIEKLKKLVEDVRSNKPILSNIDLWRVPGFDEIGIDLGVRDLYISRGGTHRLAIAKILGVKKIKACVCRIDRKTTIKL